MAATSHCSESSPSSSLIPTVSPGAASTTAAVSLRSALPNSCPMTVPSSFAHPNTVNAAATCLLSQKEKLILAKRFKTQYCRSYERQEVCPYGYNCMFAHSETERRTVDANMRDGLYTPEAINAFKRAEKAKADEQKLMTIRQRLAAAAMVMDASPSTLDDGDEEERRQGMLLRPRPAATEGSATDGRVSATSPLPSHEGTSSSTPISNNLVVGDGLLVRHLVPLNIRIPIARGGVATSVGGGVVGSPPQAHLSAVIGANPNPFTSPPAAAGGVGHQRRWTHSRQGTNNTSSGSEGRSAFFYSRCEANNHFNHNNNVHMHSAASVSSSIPSMMNELPAQPQHSSAPPSVTVGGAPPTAAPLPPPLSISVGGHRIASPPGSSGHHMMMASSSLSRHGASRDSIGAADGHISSSSAAALTAAPANGGQSRAPSVLVGGGATNAAATCNNGTATTDDVNIRRRRSDRNSQGGNRNRNKMAALGGGSSGGEGRLCAAQLAQLLRQEDEEEEEGRAVPLTGGTSRGGEGCAAEDGAALMPHRSSSMLLIDGTSSSSSSVVEMDGDDDDDAEDDGGTSGGDTVQQFTSSASSAQHVSRRESQSQQGIAMVQRQHQHVEDHHQHVGPPPPATAPPHHQDPRAPVVTVGGSGRGASAASYLTATGTGLGVVGGMGVGGEEEESYHGPVGGGYVGNAEAVAAEVFAVSPNNNALVTVGIRIGGPGVVPPPAALARVVARGHSVSPSASSMVAINGASCSLPLHIVSPPHNTHHHHFHLSNSSNPVGIGIGAPAVLASSSSSLNNTTKANITNTCSSGGKRKSHSRLVSNSSTMSNNHCEGRPSLCATPPAAAPFVLDTINQNVTVRIGGSSCAAPAAASPPYNTADGSSTAFLMPAANSPALLFSPCSPLVPTPTPINGGAPAVVVGGIVIDTPCLDFSPPPSLSPGVGEMSIAVGGVRIGGGGSVASATSSPCPPPQQQQLRSAVASPAGSVSPTVPLGLGVGSGVANRSSLPPQSAQHPHHGVRSRGHHKQHSNASCSSNVSASSSAHHHHHHHVAMPLAAPTTTAATATARHHHQSSSSSSLLLQQQFSAQYLKGQYYGTTTATTDSNNNNNYNSTSSTIIGSHFNSLGVDGAVGGCGVSTSGGGGGGGRGHGRYLSSSSSSCGAPPAAVGSAVVMVALDHHQQTHHHDHTATTMMRCGAPNNNGGSADDSSSSSRCARAAVGTPSIGVGVYRHNPYGGGSGGSQQQQQAI